MQKRDNDIQATAEEVADLKNQAMEAQISLNEQLEFLKQEENNNAEMEKQVEAAGLCLFCNHRLYI